jgi:hypothetical protein
MLSLLKIEWLKIKKYPAFWWMLAIVALTNPGINMFANFVFSNKAGSNNPRTQIIASLFGNPFSFPEAWHSVSFFSSLFVMIPATLVIMIVANEYTYKTHRQNIIDGWTRSEFVWSKMIDVFLISFVVTLSVIVIGLFFGFTVSTEIGMTRWAEQIKYIPLFFLQTFSQLSIAFLLGFVIKRSFISLGAFLFYFLILENVFIWLIKEHTPFKSLSHYLPLEISDRLIPPPAFWSMFDTAAYNESLNAIPWHVLYTCIFTAGIWWLCFYIQKKRDL